MKKHETKLVVRSYELDFFQHVNNAVYLNYLEVARVEMLEKIGLTLQELRNLNAMPVVVNININYRRPSLLHDEIVIYTHISRIGTSSFSMKHDAYNMTKGHLPSFDADVTHTIIDTITGKSKPIPSRLREALSSFHQST